MCGIFGVVNASGVTPQDVRVLGFQSERRGKDSSGLFFDVADDYKLYRAAYPISRLLSDIDIGGSKFVMGHSRLATNGPADNQPIFRDDVCVIHNGIVVNHVELWDTIKRTRMQETDTEVIAALAAEEFERTGDVHTVAKKVLSVCKGVVATAVAFPKVGKLCLFSNNGSLYVGVKGGSTYFASERFTLNQMSCMDVVQVRADGLVLDIPVQHSDREVRQADTETSNINLLPVLGNCVVEERKLEYKRYTGLRCSRCILPATMPYIKFNGNGVCNYCINYKPRNKPKPLAELFKLVEKYRRAGADDCIVPFSGGRDSCYGLHLIVNELKMKPITYTYDWGMVTDLGRRNISRVSAQLGIENIVVADDIALKRRNIALNFQAWLKAPNLGMVSILTAGDKHFFRHVESVKRQTGISLNLWGVNPLEVTHFKAGFLGVPPDFEEEKVYSNGIMKQLRYQALRLGAMAKSPGYFNRSLWDTLTGEYYRSFTNKSDYYHIFDYWRWDERVIDNTLIGQYEWETAPDTNTTWRIGDGTAAMYNYIYYTVAGFTEHDTFRSNQIREGDMTRAEALVLVEDENRPRYPNIKWYLDAIGMNFEDVIPVVNAIPKLYESD